MRKRKLITRIVVASLMSLPMLASAPAAHAGVDCEIGDVHVSRDGLRDVAASVARCKVVVN